MSALVLLLALAAVSAAREFTEEEVAQMVADAPAAESYPQAGALVLIDRQTTRYNEDLSAVTDKHLVVKLLQDRARYDFADIKHRYSKESDSVIVIKAITYLPDGGIKEVEAKAINDITPAALANASIYANIMQKVISFPGIAPGATIELKLRTYSEAPEEGEEIFIWGTELFQSEDPIFYKERSVTVPESIQVKYTVQNKDLTYETATADGFTSHTWSVEYSKQIIPEPFMPSFSKVAPRLIYTNAQSWDQVGSWVAEKFYEHVKTDGDIKKMAEKLTADAATDREKVDHIAQWVIKDVRDVGEWSLPLGLDGYEPHDADVVLSNRYGDWRDKTVLLVSLLESVGIECRPVFLHRDAANLASEYPALKQFNNMAVYIPGYGDKDLWINPFADHCQLGYLAHGQGSMALVIDREASNVAEIPDTDPDQHRSYTKLDLYLKTTGDVDGSMASQLSGYFDWQARSRLKDRTPKKVDQYFMTSANNVGEGSLSTEYETTDMADLMEPVVVRQSFTTPELGVVEGDMMIFTTPAVPFDFATSPVSLGQTSRTYDVALDNRLMMQTEGVIHLPEGYRAVFVAEPFTAWNRFGNWSCQYQLNETGDAIHFYTTVQLLDTDIDPEEYAEFKESFDSFSKPQNSLILLEKI